MNILYYGMDTSSSMSSDLQIGPYVNVTLQQVSVGIITNLIVFPPSLLLVQLFKRTKLRISRLSKIKKLLEEYNPTRSLDQEDKNKAGIKKAKKSFELKFPWWFKIIAYGLSFILACVCLFFVIMKGIVLGDDKVKKWITSVLISFLSSVLLTQPFQVTKYKA
jgi:polycystin 1L2